MVEQWSSKSHVWVRFLLSLLSSKKFFLTSNLSIIQNKPNLSLFYDKHATSQQSFQLRVTDERTISPLHIDSNYVKQTTRSLRNVESRSDTKCITSIRVLSLKNRPKFSHLFKLRSTNYSLNSRNIKIKTLMSSDYNYYKDVVSLKDFDANSLDSIKQLSKFMGKVRLSQKLHVKRYTTKFIRSSYSSKINYKLYGLLVSHMSNREMRLSVLSSRLSELSNISGDKTNTSMRSYLRQPANLNCKHRFIGSE